MSRLTEQHIPPGFGPESAPSLETNEGGCRTLEGEGDDAGTGTGTRAVAGWR
jgi:hypothetical protein